MCDVVHRIDAIDVRTHETLPAARLRETFLRDAEALLDDALTLAGDVLSACGVITAERDSLVGARTASSGSDAFELVVDAAVERGFQSIGDVEDIAFIVHLELAQRRHELDGVGDAGSALPVISACDGALRRIRKAFGAIDAAIVQCVDLPRRIDFTTELGNSLLVRESYAKFRRRILDRAEPRDDELYASLRAVGTHIAKLVGWSAYPVLRVRDRLQLRELQARIIDWLRAEHRDDAKAGRRLWQDVVGFVEMLAQVNRRQELREHDERVMRGLASGSPSDEQTVVALRSLRGLDDELDRLLATGTSVRPEDLARVIEGLVQRHLSQGSVHGG